MAIKKEILTILVAVLILAAVTCFWLENNAWAKENTETVKPFYSDNIQLIPACKNVVTNGQYTIDTSENSKLFTNIKAIFVGGVIEGYGARELMAVPFLQPDSLATLAACTLQVRNHVTKMGKPSPTYVPVRAEPIEKWPEVSSDGNLIIRLSAEIRDEHYQPTASKEKLLVLSVRYYRHDANQAEDMKYDCSEVVPFKENEDALQMAVTSSLRNCLYRAPYSF